MKYWLTKIILLFFIPIAFANKSKKDNWYCFAPNGVFVSLSEFPDLIILIDVRPDNSWINHWPKVNRNIALFDAKLHQGNDSNLLLKSSYLLNRNEMVDIRITYTKIVNDDKSDTILITACGEQLYALGDQRIFDKYSFQAPYYYALNLSEKGMLLNVPYISNNTIALPFIPKGFRMNVEILDSFIPFGDYYLSPYYTFDVKNPAYDLSNFEHFKRDFFRVLYYSYKPLHSYHFIFQEVNKREIIKLIGKKRYKSIRKLILQLKEKE